jgi:hypothetical protein
VAENDQGDRRIAFIGFGGRTRSREVKNRGGVGHRLRSLEND